MKKTTQLKNMFNSPNLEFLMEAHNGISAKIVEETGFKGIWASGLSISAALGVRDNNEASWTQVLEVCEFMSDNTDIPILLDGDTGFGNFNSFRRLVNKLEQRNIAGVCIEDKIFPKTNSFIDGEKQPLADLNEFCGKIKAGVDSKNDPDFRIVARIEAFISGWGLEIALKRARAYADAGADAILVHSKIKTSADVDAFMANWDRPAPIVIVPTMYYQTPAQHFQDIGVSTVIWANHNVRAAITSMQKISKQIYEEVSLAGVQEQIVPVKEIFRLQNAQEYKSAEGKYLPQPVTFKGLVLAATKGQNFGTLTDDKPKAMIRIGNEPLLAKIVKTFNQRNIKDISVVVGYEKDKVNLPSLKYIENSKFETTGILNSLKCGEAVFNGPAIVSFGDIIFEEAVLRKLIKAEGDIVIAVDASKNVKNGRERDLVIAEHPYADDYGVDYVSKVKNMLENKEIPDPKTFDGEFIGLFKLSEKGASIIKSELALLEKENPEFLAKEDLNSFFNYLINKGINVNLCYFRGHWRDIDSIEDLTYLFNVFSEGTPK